jgi:hypothetical protein
LETGLEKGRRRPTLVVEAGEGGGTGVVPLGSALSERARMMQRKRGIVLFFYVENRFSQQGKISNFHRGVFLVAGS